MPCTMQLTRQLTRVARRASRTSVTVILALISPLMEKHPLKSAPMTGQWTHSRPGRTAPRTAARRGATSARTCTRTTPGRCASIRGRRLPFVFSMSRLIVLAFAAAMLHQAWLAGIAGWPEATLSIAIVLALPILGALERARPADTIALAKALLGRFGTGATRHAGSLFGHEPSKFDDHRDDSREAA